MPHGFFENELRSFFKQFGKVSNVKVARSKRTANSKGYGWVEFQSKDVAEIACKTMDSYLLFKKKLVCRVLPQDQIGKNLFRNSKRKMLPSRRPDIHKAAVNAEITEERKKKIEKRSLEKLKKQEKKWKELGIEYEFGNVDKKQQQAEKKQQEQPEKAKKSKKKRKKTVK